MRTGLTLSLVTLIGWSLPGEALARAPSAARLTRELTAHWAKHWPDQQLAHVSRVSEGCEDGEIEIAGRRGKPTRVKTCRLRIDAFVARGYRYLIYRGSEAHFRGERLVSLQLGELEKAWKAGGVPAPSEAQLLELLAARAAELGAEAEMRIRELGIPRPFGEVYRFSAVVDLSYSHQGKLEQREGLLATLESDGGDWRLAPGLVF